MVYDLIVIGGGPCRLLAAERAGKEGFRFCLLKKIHRRSLSERRMIPSRPTLLAKLYDGLPWRKYGVTAKTKLTMIM